MRSFIGIDLPQGHCDALERLQADLPAGRPVPPENFHLTLAFLGDQPELLLEEVHLGLETMRVTPVEILISGLDTFGRQTPAVLFAAVGASPALTRLRDKVRNVARSAGLDLPRERFRPHVTLARFDREMRFDDLERLRIWLSRHGNFALPAFTAQEMTLFRSTLTRSGAVHDALAVYPLVAA